MGKNREQDSKAVEGSYEYLSRQIEDALTDADVLDGELYVRDTFPDRVVVSVWTEGESHRYFEVAYTETDDGFDFGDPVEVEVEVEETIVEKRRPETKQRPANFELKSLAEVGDDVGGWEAYGVFSVYDYFDHSKDRALPGCTAESLKARLPKVKDHHGATVGQATKAWEDDAGLHVEYRIYPTTAGKDLATLMKAIETEHGPQAPVQEGSVGFSVPEGGATKNNQGGWDFSRWDVWEVSPVTFGDNDQTYTGLKSLEAMGAMPTAESLEYACQVAEAAMFGEAGAKALYSRRVDDGRSLSDPQWRALQKYVTAIGDNLVEATELLVGGGKASTAQLRHTRAIIEGLTDLVQGRREPEKTPELEGDGGDDADTKGKPEGDPDDVASRVKALREIEAKWLRAEARRLGITEVRS